MKHNEQTEEGFLKDVANHEMTILLDNGIHRHLRFRAKKDSWNQWFDVVTWPGFLAYSGDMGCFVFARLPDMFQFFRSKPEANEALYINQSYWAEKLEAVDRCGNESGYKAFSEEKMRAHIDEHIATFFEDHGISEDDKTALQESVEEDVYPYLGDGPHEAHRAVRDFDYKCSSGETFEFHDAWEWSCEEYTLRYAWCCFAVTWAIRQYDTAKANEKEVVSA